MIATTAIESDPGCLTIGRTAGIRYPIPKNKKPRWLSDKAHHGISIYPRHWKVSMRFCDGLPFTPSRKDRNLFNGSLLRHVDQQVDEDKPLYCNNHLPIAATNKECVFYRSGATSPTPAIKWAWKRRRGGF